MRCFSVGRKEMEVAKKGLQVVKTVSQGLLISFIVDLMLTYAVD